MNDEQWWFCVYVILSRVRHIGHLLLYGLPPKSLFESGPPAWLRLCLREFDLRIRDTDQRAEGLLPNFNNSNVYERRSSTAADSGRGVSQEFCLPDEVQHQNGKRDFAHIMREREESKGCVANMPSSSGCPDRLLADLLSVEASPQAILNGSVCVAVLLRTLGGWEQRSVDRIEVGSFSVVQPNGCFRLGLCVCVYFFHGGNMGERAKSTQCTSPHIIHCSFIPYKVFSTIYKAFHIMPCPSHYTELLLTILRFFTRCKACKASL